MYSLLSFFNKTGANSQTVVARKAIYDIYAEVAEAAGMPVLSENKGFLPVIQCLPGFDLVRHKWFYEHVCCHVVPSHEDVRVYLDTREEVEGKGSLYRMAGKQIDLHQHERRRGSCNSPLIKVVSIHTF